MIPPATAITRMRQPRGTSLRRRLAALGRVVIAVGMCVFSEPDAARATATDAHVRAQLGGLRLPFIANQGQLDPRVTYYAPTFAGTLFVTAQGELVYALRTGTPAAPRPRPLTSSGLGWSLTETLLGGRPTPVALHRSPTGVSAFLGPDPARWRAALPAYEQVSLGQVWPGVTVTLRARGRSIEKVFTVSPHASLDRIRVRMGGAEALSVGPDGALVARTGLGEVTFSAPVAYQERDGLRRSIPVAYQLTGHDYHFRVGDYDRTLPLVIDPLLRSTYLGGSSDDAAFAIAINPATNDVYLAGGTISTNFPAQAGAMQPVSGGGADAFVARLSSDLTALVQATYLGGSGDDLALALAINPTTHDVYVTGHTGSADFPLTAGGAQPTSGGNGDAFVARLRSDLTALTQATYLGGTDFDAGYAVAIAPITSEVYVTGHTASMNFPQTSAGAQPASGGNGDAFVARLRGDLTALTQATYLGGSDTDAAYALAIHPITSEVYVGGVTGSTDLPRTGGGPQPAFGGLVDGFVARLSSDLTALIQATYLGGSGIDSAYALAIAPTSHEVYVGGETSSTNFPGAGGGAQPASGGLGDAFVARLSGDLTALTQATYLGGSSIDAALALAINPTTNDIYVAGGTSSSSFPGASGGAQAVFGGGSNDAFVARLSSDLTALTQATYLGGRDFDGALALAIHPTTNDVYLAGGTNSTDFPGTGEGAQSTNGGATDAFAARLTSSLVSVDPAPDLTLTKTHTGHFIRGQVGATYTLTVSNVGAAATNGSTVTVTDTLPTGLTATALTGAGWSCALATLTCTRSTALAGGSTYPAITLTVNVAANAPSAVTNSATVAGGGDLNPANNTATDPTTILAPDLAIAKTHSGNFFQGQPAATYTLTVTNLGPAATSGPVTVTDALPPSLLPLALSGSGWSCTLGMLTCTRADPLAAGSSYPAITLTVIVALVAPSSLTNTATVSGGGDPNVANNTVSDVTAINPSTGWPEGGIIACQFSPPLLCWPSDTPVAGSPKP